MKGDLIYKSVEEVIQELRVHVETLKDKWATSPTELNDALLAEATFLLRLFSSRQK